MRHSAVCNEPDALEVMLLLCLLPPHGQVCVLHSEKEENVYLTVSCMSFFKSQYVLKWWDLQKFLCRK